MPILRRINNKDVTDRMASSMLLIHFGTKTSSFASSSVSWSALVSACFGYLFSLEMGFVFKLIAFPNFTLSRVPPSPRLRTHPTSDSRYFSSTFLFYLVICTPSVTFRGTASIISCWIFGLGKIAFRDQGNSNWLAFFLRARRCTTTLGIFYSYILLRKTICWSRPQNRIFRYETKSPNSYRKKMASEFTYDTPDPGPQVSPIYKEKQNLFFPKILDIDRVVVI